MYIYVSVFMIIYIYVFEYIYIHLSVCITALIHSQGLVGSVEYSNISTYQSFNFYDFFVV